MMTKQLAIQDENICHLAEEIKGIIGNATDLATIGMIAAKHMIGEAIVTNPLYKKYSKTQSEFYGAISKESGMRRDTLADCVKFYERYPKLDSKLIASDLYSEHGSWRNIRLEMYEGKSEHRSESEPKCRPCPLHHPALCPNPKK